MKVPDTEMTPDEWQSFFRSKGWAELKRMCADGLSNVDRQLRIAEPEMIGNLQGQAATLMDMIDLETIIFSKMEETQTPGGIYE